ncbi:MAG TPA: nuclear transport factor 2 family protein [Solirubrobacteraceae bacterium]|nr:nuclear transport factor 2 family protein [Solirubrobacteraceae bacterium]
MSITTDQTQELGDRREIADLIARLGLMLDEKRFGETASILADDVTVKTPGGSAQGREAVAAQASRNHTVRTQHVISNVLIELDGDRAQARANLIATFAPDPGSRLVINGEEQRNAYLTLGEVYRFGARRTADGWRLERIETEPVWSSQRLAGGARVEQTAGVPAPSAS